MQKFLTSDSLSQEMLIEGKTIEETKLFGIPFSLFHNP